MNAEEFAQWIVWMDAEQIGPQWDRFRHAQMLAAVQNGGRYEHTSKRPFYAADFMPDDPWCAKPSAAQLSREQRVKQVNLELAVLESAFFAPGA